MVSPEVVTMPRQKTEAFNPLIFPEDCVLTSLPQEARQAIVGLRENPNPETLKTAASVFKRISVQVDGREIIRQSDDGKPIELTIIHMKMLLIMLASSSKSNPVLRSDLVRFTNGLSRYNNRSWDAIDNCNAELSVLRGILFPFGFKIQSSANGKTQWGAATVYLVRLGDKESFCSNSVGNLTEGGTENRKNSLNNFPRIKGCLQLNEDRKKHLTMSLPELLAYEEQRLSELQSDLAMKLLTHLDSNKLDSLLKDPLAILESSLESSDINLRPVVKDILNEEASNSELVQKNAEIIRKLREFVVCSLAEAIKAAFQEPGIRTIGDHPILEIRALIFNMCKRGISLMKMIRAAYQYFDIPVPDKYQDKLPRSSQDLGISFIPISAPLEGIAPSALSSEAKCSVC